MLFNIILQRGKRVVANINKDIRPKLPYQSMHGSNFYQDNFFLLLFLFVSSSGGSPLNFLGFFPANYDF